MDTDFRLKIKRDLISHCQNSEGDLSYLDYGNVEIVDPEPHVDDEMVELLDREIDIELSDKLFFECLDNSIDYLAYEPFRVKIKQWMDQIDEFENQPNLDVYKSARENLERLSLLFNPKKDRRGRPAAKFDGFSLHAQVEGYKRLLIPFLKETEGLTKNKRKKEFLKKFTCWEDCTSALNKRTAGEMAKVIVCIKCCVPMSSLLSKLKSVKEMGAMGRPFKPKNSSSPAKPA